MNVAGIGPAEYLIICFNLLMVVAWPGLALLVLLSMRGRALAGTAQALWLLIHRRGAVPGGLAFCTLRRCAANGGPAYQTADHLARGRHPRHRRRQHPRPRPRTAPHWTNHLPWAILGRGQHRSLGHANAQRSGPGHIGRGYPDRRLE